MGGNDQRDNLQTKLLFCFFFVILQSDMIKDSMTKVHHIDLYCLRNQKYSIVIVVRPCAKIKEKAVSVAPLERIESNDETYFQSYLTICSI